MDQPQQLYEGAMRVLVAVAKKTLSRLGDRSGMVEEGDLISEGWLRSMRYAKNERQRKWQPFYLHLHMFYSYNRLRRFWHDGGRSGRDFPNGRVDFEVAADSEIYHEEDGYRDLWDAIEVYCTEREMEVIRLREKGMSYREVGMRLGVSGERIRQILVRIRQKLLVGGIGDGQSTAH